MIYREDLVEPYLLCSPFNVGTRDCFMSGKTQSDEFFTHPPLHSFSFFRRNNVNTPPKGEPLTFELALKIAAPLFHDGLQLLVINHRKTLFKYS